jgi:hypothetical protein
VSGSRPRAQPSATQDPATGRQTALSADKRTMAKALAAARAITRYPPPGTPEYDAWRDKLHAHLEFARLHQDSAHARSQTQQGPRSGAEHTQTVVSGCVLDPAPQPRPPGRR